ncbi:MAG: indolepyruvate oxidoreductase subunit beta [Bacillota bacterium]
MKTTNVIVAGVGGQGSILAAHILGKAAIREKTPDGKPLQVRIGETYGAAMRGGKVFSHVRFGDARAPLTMEDAAELIIGLEPLEALRVAIPYLSPNGVCIVNTAKYVPADVKMGRAKYPAIPEIVDSLKKLGRKVIAFDATAAAKGLGKPQVMSVVMLGAASATGLLPLDEPSLLATIEAEAPKGTAELNLKAFRLGREIAEDLSRSGSVGEVA